MENKNKFKDIGNEELLAELNETVGQAVSKVQTQKGEITTIIICNLPNIFEMYMNGATTAQVCERLGIQVRAYNKIKESNKQLQAVISAAEEAKTDMVRQSLFMMTQPRIQKTQKVLSNGKIVEYDAVIQPDANLVKFFLLNKAAEEFKDKQEVTITKRNFIIDIVDADYMVEDVRFTAAEEEKDNTDNNK